MAQAFIAICYLSAEYVCYVVHINQRGNPSADMVMRTRCWGQREGWESSQVEVFGLQVVAGVSCHVLCHSTWFILT